MSKEINITKSKFPKKAVKEDYFKAAVLYLVSNTKPIFSLCEKREETDIDDPKIKAIIKAAVPGHNSTLMHIEIMTNVNQHIIDDQSLDLNQKIAKIADSIRKYVQFVA